MAIKSVKDKITLRIRLVENDEEGKEKFSSRSYNNVKADAQDQAIYNTGKILSKMQTKTLSSIGKVETTIFEEE